jgi:hypothetical protein
MIGLVTGANVIFSFRCSRVVCVFHLGDAGDMALLSDFLVGKYLLLARYAAENGRILRGN